MIGGIGMPELLVILVIILIIFGAGKLPEIGSGLGRGIKNFRKATSGAEELEKSSEQAKIEETKEEV
ncbi:MAG: twin-arginine translocase TatA/TatE family subunit [Deltaproteobacteria bacterium]|nr:MAG: twin-arginine translocase TatA/TatE family subunit [Deltaproteobacteria bacterium]